MAMTDIETLLQQSKRAFYQMAILKPEQKNDALLKFADLIEQHATFLLDENKNDLEQAPQDIVGSSLYQRLKLDLGKITQLVQGLRDLVRLPDPVGQTLSKTLLDDGLILEKVTVPLGVIGIIFESRPDVIPQVLSLILKSGNAVVLKGGKEARYSNAAFMSLVEKLNQACPWLPTHWATLLESREAVHEILHYPQYVDLIIPRGSNQLVQSIMAATRIPVLGHADGVCHLYVHPSANLEKAIPLIIDAKAHYPSACNALETLLVDQSIANEWLPLFAEAALNASLTLKGCESTRQVINVAPATEADWKAEYGDLTLAVKVVPGLIEAMQHINHYGSHHTDAILAQEPSIIEEFLNTVDSACVFANASTRFADGFRFGLGAEIGISTSKTHARGPVGLEGLVSTKFKLQGNHHRVTEYTGEQARPFRHEALK